MSIQKKNLCHVDLHISSPDCRKIFLKKTANKGLGNMELYKANKNLVDK
jgi:hypothetical protein